MQGKNQDSNISIKANAEWDSEKNFYKVEAKINNKTNEMIQVLYDCSDLISYLGKSHQNGCKDAYSMGIKKGDNYFENIEIPKKHFKIDSGNFNITIQYQLDGDSEIINEITIPLKAANNQGLR